MVPAGNQPGFLQGNTGSHSAKMLSIARLIQYLEVVDRLLTETSINQRLMQEVWVLGLTEHINRREMQEAWVLDLHKGPIIIGTL